MRNIGKALNLSAAALMSLGLLLAAPTDTASARQPNNTLELTTYAPGTAPAGFAGICSKYAWACSGAAGKRQLGHQELIDLASSINLSVNREIVSRTDLDNYGAREHWTLPTNGYGDCEDYALLKMKRLIDAGVAPRDLFLSTVVGRTDEVHIVLVLRTAQGDFILDNLTNRISHWSSTSYTFIKKQDPQRPSRWTVVLLGPRATRS